MSFDICIWKGNEQFSFENAPDIYGQLCEEDGKPDAIDSTPLIRTFVEQITAIYPSLNDDPDAIWSSSFMCSDWHCAVSLSFKNGFEDTMMDIIQLCENLSLNCFDPQSGDMRV